MTELTALAVLVGADTHVSQAYGDLPGARRDVELLAATLESAGMAPASVNRLTGPDASRRNCLQAIRTWPREVTTGPLRLLIFFSGHGVIVGERALGDVNVLVTCDTDPADPGGTGLPIEDLAKAVEHSRPHEVFLFVDACEVDATVADREPDRLLVRYISAQTVFCLFAAPHRYAIETTGPNAAGLFTVSLAQALAARPPLTCAGIAESVTTSVVAKNGAEPQTVVSGNVRASPLAGVSQMAPPAQPLKTDAVPRPDAVALVLRQLSKHRRIWLHGPSGSGKSTIIALLAERSERRPIVTSPPVPGPLAGLDVEQTMTRIAGSVAEQAVELFPSGRPPIDGFEGALRTLKRASASYLLVIDHLDRLGHAAAEAAARALGSFPGETLFVSVHPPPLGLDCVAVPMPPLTEAEVAAFIDRYTPETNRDTAVLLRWKAEANPLKLRAALATSTHETLEPQGMLSHAELDVVDTLLASRGCLNIDLLVETTGVRIAALRSLIAGGLVVRSGDLFACHDTLARMRSPDAVAAKRATALAYWVGELDQGTAVPQASQAIPALIVDEMDASLFAHMPQIVRDLFEMRQWHHLEHLASAVARSRPAPGWSTACLALVQVFVTTARHTNGQALLDAVGAHRDHLHEAERVSYDTLKSEHLWWFGDFAAAIALATELVDDYGSTSARLSRGIAHWFAGQWDAADRDLEAVLADDTADRRTAGWARLMLASSRGLRGQRIEEVRRQFREAAGLLALTGDDVGVAICWGNFGEISWKLGAYEDAELQLARALHIAENACGTSQIVEIQRSVIETAMRARGPWSDELNEALATALSMYQPSMGPTVKMQLLNTLATVSAVRGDRDSAAEYLHEVAQFTTTNPEYEIYTQANRAAVAILDGQVSAAAAHVREAMLLAGRGGNLLAPRQVRQALELLIQHARLPERVRADAEAQVLAAI